MLSQVDINNIANLPAEEKREMLKLLEDYEQALKVQNAQNSYMGFVQHMWPAFIEGRHHKLITCMVFRAIPGQKNYTDRPHRRTLGWVRAKSSELGRFR